MPELPTDSQILVRLALAVLAGALLGLNRGAHGHAAGFRTTILVGLAAAVAMVQAELLLAVDGKTSGSFAVADILRLPLGILTGVGFIGAGTILRRGNLVTGITTAATLWMMTVIGLCFGGGQLRLGIEATLLSLFTLFILKWLDARLPREHRATLVLRADAAGSVTRELDALLLPLGYHAKLERQLGPGDARDTQLGFIIHWKRSEAAGPPLDLFKLLNAHFSIVSFEALFDDHS